MFGQKGVLNNSLDNSKIECHICGCWYKSLTYHVYATHGMLPSDYREKFDLAIELPLVSKETSTKLSAHFQKLLVEGKVHLWIKGENVPNKRPQIHRKRQLSTKLKMRETHEPKKVYYCSNCGKPFTILLHGKVRKTCGDSECIKAMTSGRGKKKNLLTSSLSNLSLAPSHKQRNEGII